MPKTLLVAEFVLPHASLARTSDFQTAIREACKTHKVTEPFFTISGPHPETLKSRGTTDEARNDDASRTGDRERPEHQRQAADDFGDGSEGSGPFAADGPDAGKPGRKPRADAGKPRGPRGGAPEGGKAAEGPERPAGRSGGEGRAVRNGDAGAPQGREQRGGEGEGRQRQDDGGGRRPRRADGRNGEAPRVGAADEEWGSEPVKPDPIVHPTGEEPAFDTFEEAEEWWCKTPDTDGWPDNLMPEEPLSVSVLISVLAEHLKATGGKDKNLTRDVLEGVTGVRDPSHVEDADLDNAIRALLRDAAKYTYGVKKPVKSVPKA